MKHEPQFWSDGVGTPRIERCRRCGAMREQHYAGLTEHWSEWRKQGLLVGPKCPGEVNQSIEEARP